MEQVCKIGHKMTAKEFMRLKKSPQHRSLIT